MVHCPRPLSFFARSMIHDHSSVRFSLIFLQALGPLLCTVPFCMWAVFPPLSFCFSFPPSPFSRSPFFKGEFLLVFTHARPKRRKVRPRYETKSSPLMTVFAQHALFYASRVPSGRTVCFYYLPNPPFGPVRGPLIDLRTRRRPRVGVSRPTFQASQKWNGPLFSLLLFPLLLFPPARRAERTCMRPSSSFNRYSRRFPTTISLRPVVVKKPRSPV